MRLPLPLAGLALLLAAVLPSNLDAQATRDQARLVISVSPAYMFGNDLWRVTGQPLVDGSTALLLTDTVNLVRRVRPGFGVAFAGAYFPGDHLGFTGEAFLVGLGYEDACVQTHVSGSVRNDLVCESIDGAEKASSAVAVSVGAIYRVQSRRIVSPYARASVGMTLSSQSSLRLSGLIDDPVDGRAEQVVVPVYTDESDTRLTPSLGLGIGFTAQLTPSYHLRWEFRDQITGIHVVDGPSEGTPVEPRSSLEFRHILGMTIGLDVVFERRRGRRY